MYIASACAEDVSLLQQSSHHNLQLDKGKILTCRIIGIIRVLVVHSELNMQYPAHAQIMTTNS